MEKEAEAAREGDRDALCGARVRDRAEPMCDSELKETERTRERRVYMHAHSAFPDREHVKVVSRSFRTLFVT